METLKEVGKTSGQIGSKKEKLNLWGLQAASWVETADFCSEKRTQPSRQDPKEGRKGLLYFRKSLAQEKKGSKRSHR